MDIMNSTVFFSIATKTDLKENYNMTINIINTVLDYFKKVTDQKFMMCYVDNKAFRKNNLTEKNYEKLIDKLKNNNVFRFIGIEKQMTNKEFFGMGMMPEFEPQFECILHIGEPNSGRELGNACDLIKVGVPSSFLKDKNNQDEIIGLMRNLQTMMNGLCSFINVGTFLDDYSAGCAIFDLHYYPAPIFFSMCWDNYVRGYFWGQCLTPTQVEKLGGFDEIQKQGFYLCEYWGDCVYIQITERILDYTMEDALKIREFLKPLFPPESEKRHSSYMNKEDLAKYKMKNLLFYADEDMVLENNNE